MEKKAEKEKKTLNMKEIDLISLLRFLWRRTFLILLSGILFGGAFCAYTIFVVEPTYSSTFTAYVNNNNGQQARQDGTLTNTDLIASQQLVKTYSQIITSRTILEASAKSIQFDASYQEILGMVVTTQDSETEIIRVGVVAKSPKLAYELNKAIAETAPSYVERIVEGSSMQIIDAPVLPQKKYGPNVTKETLIGFAVGVFIAVVLITIKYFTDDTVENEKEIEEAFPYPVVGIIPDLESIGEKAYYDSYRYAYKEHNKDENGDNRR